MILFTCSFHNYESANWNDCVSGGIIRFLGYRLVIGLFGLEDIFDVALEVCGEFESEFQ